MKIVVTLLVVLLLLSCSGSDKNVEKSIIRDILQQIEDSFNRTEDLDRIMRFYHRDFLHKGGNIYYWEGEWHDRMVLYQRLSIEIISDIEVINEYATARLKITFTDVDGRETMYIDPETFGDMSYFLYEPHNDWKIIGNGLLE